MEESVCIKVSAFKLTRKGDRNINGQRIRRVTRHEMYMRYKQSFSFVFIHPVRHAHLMDFLTSLYGKNVKYFPGNVKKGKGIRGA